MHEESSEIELRAAPGRGRRRLTRSQIVALTGLGLLVGIGGLLTVTSDGFGVTERELRAWIDSLGAWGPVAVVGLMIVHSFVPFPAEILALCAGAAFGTVRGTLFIWIGAMLGAALAFGLARWLGRGAVERLVSPHHRDAFDDWAHEQGVTTLLVSRLIPVIAFNLINYAAGLTAVGWWTFLWTTGVGILPITVAVVYMGARMAELSWPWLLAVSAVAIIVIAVLHRLAKRRGWLERHRRRD